MLSRKVIAKLLKIIHITKPFVVKMVITLTFCNFIDCLQVNMFYIDIFV